MRRPVVVAIPCFNEEHRLQRDALLDFARREPDVRLLLVNDGSTDRTLARCQELSAELPQSVGVLDLVRNRGKGEAVRAGMLQAIGEGARFVGFWDADLATPLRDIVTFHRLLEDHPQLEMVFGARVRLLGRDIQRHTSRHYAGRVFATAVSTMLALPVYDTQCGAKLFRVTPDLSAALSEPFLSRWVFDVELLARFTRDRRGTSRPQVADIIYEYPLEQWHDVHGSKLRLSDFAKAVGDLLRIRRRYLSRSSVLSDPRSRQAARTTPS